MKNTRVDGNRFVPSAVMVVHIPSSCSYLLCTLRTLADVSRSAGQLPGTDLSRGHDLVWWRLFLQPCGRRHPIDGPFDQCLYAAGHRSDVPARSPEPSVLWDLGS
jgi:hypothetical protein